MKLEILTPDAIIFNGEVERVAFPGIGGGFEILKGHAPLISALKEGKIKVTASSNITNYEITGGFVEVLNNTLTVLVEGTKKA